MFDLNEGEEPLPRRRFTRSYKCVFSLPAVGVFHMLLFSGRRRILPMPCCEKRRVDGMSTEVLMWSSQGIQHCVKLPSSFEVRLCLCWTVCLGVIIKVLGTLPCRAALKIHTYTQTKSALCLRVSRRDALKRKHGCAFASCHPYHRRHQPGV